MKEEEFKTLLIKALDMPEVWEKIKSLLSHGEEVSLNNVGDKKLQAENAELKSLLSEKDNEISDLESQNKSFQKDNEKLKKENEKLRDSLDDEKKLSLKLKKERDELKVELKPFEKICKMLEIYAKISSKVKDSLKNLLGKGSPEELISCSLRQGNLENLWESGRVLAMRQDYDSAKKIGELLEFMIESYARFNSSAEKLSVKIGESFDDRKHIHSENKNRVKIAEVLLPGLVVKGTVCLKGVVR